MKVILLGNYPLEQMESMHRYADMMHKGLSARGLSVELIRPAAFLGRLKYSVHGIGKWFGYVDKFVLFLPKLLWVYICNPDAIIHICDHSNAVYCRYAPWRRTVVTCHDLIAIRSSLGHFYQNKVSFTGRMYQEWIVSGLRASKYIVCDSEATRCQLLALGGFSPDHSETIYLGLNSPYIPLTDDSSLLALRERDEIAQLGMQGYLLHVGGHGWYKNRVGLLRIYFHYIRSGGRLPLVLAGRAMAPELRELMKQCPPSGRVIEAIDVSDMELNALYARAATLVFPSLYEGFGWPVLEALSVGCPVICSRRASLPEVGHDAAFYIDPDDELGAAAVVDSVLKQPPEVLRWYRERGYAHSGTFTVELMFSRIIRRYGAMKHL